jgi:UDP-N-acetyl-2-amino-2-deoxyglucuronate dehydrogenase
MKHRVGIIGLGMAVTPHAKSLMELAAGADVAAAFSRSARRREAFGAQFPFPLTGDLDSIFDDPAIDIVAVLTPPDSHLDLVRRAAARGKHVLLEKPLDISTRRAETMAIATERAGIVVGVMLQHRFKPAAERLKQVLAEEGLGRIVGVSARAPLWRPQSYYDVEGRGTRARDGGGVLISQAIHTLDLMLSLAGPVAEVKGFAGYGAAHKMETEDIVAAAMRFESGAIGVVEATTAFYPGNAERIEITGTAGTAILEGTGLALRWQDGRSETVSPDALPGGVGADPMAFSHHYHLAAWRDFLDALDEGRPPRVPPREALKVHYLIDAILEAGTGGVAVSQGFQ